MRLKLPSILFFAGSAFLLCRCAEGGQQEPSPTLPGWNGTYKGLVAVHHIRFPHYVKDTIEVELNLEDSTFQHGSCSGTVSVMGDSLSFVHTGPNACPEEEAGLMLGKKAFTISGDSLYLWNTKGPTEVDPTTGINWASHTDLFFSLGRQE